MKYTSLNSDIYSNSYSCIIERSYPKVITDVAASINQPRLPELVRCFLYDQLHSDTNISSFDVPLESCPCFNGHIAMFHSAIAHFYAPSDMSGAGGMRQERIRSTPSWQGVAEHRDTVVIETDGDREGMAGMHIGRVLLFFSFIRNDIYYPCVLVHWLVTVGPHVDDETGLWIVKLETVTGNGNRSQPHLAVVHLDCIARAAHLIGVYGSAFLPEDFDFTFALDAFQSFYINTYTDHHMHEFLTQ